MNSSCRLLKSFKNSKFKIIYRYKKVPRPESFLFKMKQSKLDDSYDTEKTFFGYSLLAIPIITFCLGTWQIQRRQWKLNLLKEIESRFNLEPTDLPNDLNDLKNMEYIPVKVKGTYLHDKEITIGPRSLIPDNMELNEKNKTFISSTAGTGYIVITPFKLKDRDLTILVNRGWIPEQYRDASTRLLGQTEGIQEITGIVRLTEKKPTFVPVNKPKENRWFYRNIEEIADLVGADPVFIDLAPASRKRGTPISGQTKTSLRNEHFSYILTWYSLSVITSYLWYRQVIQKLPLF